VPDETPGGRGLGVIAPAPSPAHWASEILGATGAQCAIARALDRNRREYRAMRDGVDLVLTTRTSQLRVAPDGWIFAELPQSGRDRTKGPQEGGTDGS
jgi:hypothetical protein